MRRRKNKNRVNRLGKYKSRLEKDVARKLPKGTEYETEKLPYTLVKRYIPDFIIPTPNGKIYLEVKGYLRPEDRTKMIAVKEANPALDIRFYFPVNNKLRKDSKTRYSDWCEKHSFPYYIGKLPKEWN